MQNTVSKNPFGTEPARSRKPFDPNGDNVVVIQSKTHAVRIVGFSDIFYKKSRNADGTGGWNDAQPGETGAVQRIAIKVRFKKIKNRKGQPLELSCTVNYKFGPESTLGGLIASTLGIDPEDANQQRLRGMEVIGRSASAITKVIDMPVAHSIVKKVVASDDDDDVATPAPTHVVDEDIHDEALEVDEEEEEVDLPY